MVKELSEMKLPAIPHLFVQLGAGLTVSKLLRKALTHIRTKAIEKYRDKT